MSNINCVIVEDEPLAVKILVDYIAELPFLQLKGTFKDAIDASEFLLENPVDLILLDIHLPRLKGMDFLRTLHHMPHIIITTAYHQYAVEGFELNVTDYLMKPIAFPRFIQAVNKVAASMLKDQVKPREALYLSVGKKKIRIPFSEILYVESQREYVLVVMQDKEVRCKMSTTAIESLLPTKQFKRVHRSFIVAIDRVEGYTVESVEIKGREIPVGRKYRNVVEGLF